MPIFKHQIYHLLFLILALPMLHHYAIYSNRHQVVIFWPAIGVAILHQCYVWLAWRMELNTKFITKNLGKHGIYAYLADFFLLLLSRFALVIYLALIDQQSWNINHDLVSALSILIISTAGYTLYSVIRYFGFVRAAGMDHFLEEYQRMPLVQQGIFQFIPNPIYTFAIQLIWLPGLWAESQLALLVALFTSSYIWVHYFCTEKPDMEFIYQTK